MIRYFRTLAPVAGAFAFLMAAPATAQIAKTPPMGWNSWNHFKCNENGGIKQSLFQEMADAMVSSGMKDAGYNYVNVDDCWHGIRKIDGTISASDQFTGGSMVTLAKYLHDRGLKFGLYTCVGTATCANKPGSYGHEDQDMKTYAEWGADYVKVDWCYKSATQESYPAAAYKIFSDAIKKYSSIRPMVLSICTQGQKRPWEWGRGAGGQLWRSTPDISLGWDSFTGIIDQEVKNGVAAYAGPGAGATLNGAWNDPDMLEVGRGMTVEEDKSHFGMWCLLAAPLIAGNDLRSMNTATKEILTNRELIAVDQDSLGIEGLLVKKTGDMEVWARPLMGGGRAVGLFNRNATTPQAITVNWADLDQSANANAIIAGKWKPYPWPASKVVNVRNLWTKAEEKDKTGSYTATVAPHGLVVLKLYDPANAVRRFSIGRATLELRDESLKIHAQGDFTLRILDLTGRLLWQKKGTGEAEYRVGDIGHPGSRILQVRTASTRTVTKF
jgi:alpha-galactosidase